MDIRVKGVLDGFLVRGAIYRGPTPVLSGEDTGPVVAELTWDPAHSALQGPEFTDDVRGPLYLRGFGADGTCHVISELIGPYELLEKGTPVTFSVTVSSA